jgi:hypothetical protein
MWKRILPLLLVASVADAQIYTITTVAGGGTIELCVQHALGDCCGLGGQPLHRPFRLGPSLIISREFQRYGNASHRQWHLWVFR